MKNYGIVLIFCFLLANLSVYAQGKIMLVGGGAEDIGDWSDTPYRWAVNQANNKRVAVVGFSEASNWLPDYFVGLGARQAKNFTINSNIQANDKATYDSLMSYDLLFFRGGDQSNYYNTYKGTLVQRALQDKFRAGGVLAGTSAGMAILSEIIYTANAESIFPDEALRNPMDAKITMANDFLPELLKGHIVDTHFIERGRFARLVAFMANWFLRNGKAQTVGIGVDDKTAFCIDQNALGTAYGLGAINLYRNVRQRDYQNQNKLIVDSLQVSQLVHGKQINLQTGNIIGYTTNLTATPNFAMSSGATMLLSGSNDLTENASFLSHLARNTGNPTDPILIISDNQNNAETIRRQLNTLGATNCNILIKTQSPANEWINWVRGAGKYLFTNNANLTDFFANTPTGQELAQYIRLRTKTVAFLGDDSRWAGSSWVENYQRRDASYNGEMTYRQGLGLISSAIVQPNTYLTSTDFYENTTSAVPFGMTNQRLQTGIWLTRDNFAKITTQANAIRLEGFGSYPVMVLQNPNTRGEVTTQKALRKNNSRQIGGFEQMWLSLVGNNPITLAINNTNILANANSQLPEIEVTIYPNPTGQALSVNLSERVVTQMFITDSQGRTVWEKQGESREKLQNIDLTALPKGIYFLQICTDKGNSLKRFVLE